MSGQRRSNAGAWVAWLVLLGFYAVLVYAIRYGDPVIFWLAAVVGAMMGVGMFAAGHLFALHQARARQIELARHLAERQRAEARAHGA